MVVGVDRVISMSQDEDGGRGTWPSDWHRDIMNRTIIRYANWTYPCHVGAAAAAVFVVVRDFGFLRLY